MFDALQNHSLMEMSISLVGDKLEVKVLTLGTLDHFSDVTRPSQWTDVIVCTWTLLSIPLDRDVFQYD